MSVLAAPKLEQKPGLGTISGGRAALYAAGVLSVALLLAGCIRVLQAGRAPEQGVLLTGVFLALFIGAAPAVYVFRFGRWARPEIAGLAFLAASAVALLAMYLYWVSWYVFFPADFLIWAEGDFVNDIVKIAHGYPIYSPQVNNDSFFYVPGAQALTALLAALAGHAKSVTAFRVIQVMYTAAAAFLATLCCRRILRLVAPESTALTSGMWHALWYAGLFLIATNSITNPFTHNLHGDALALVAALAGYYLLLRYCETPGRGMLIGLAVFVPLGFLVRQSLLPWGAFLVVFLAAFDRNWKRLVTFTGVMLALVAATLGVCYALWGAPFFYWTFSVLGKHAVSPLRAFQHALVAWPYFAIGLLGGAVLLEPGAMAHFRFRALTGAWLVWLAVIATETYTSGIAWMLNHIGPGSLIAGVWFMAGLAKVWQPAAKTWMRAVPITASVALFFSGMGIIRIPMQAIPEDAYRYVRDIEAQFRGLPPQKVLLDAGSWIYLKDGLVMGDRAPSIGERGMTLTGDFSGILARIAQKRYSRILVRGLHDRDFVYDYYLWPKSSGIRQALLDNYHETAAIPAVGESLVSRSWAEDPYYFGAISILEPKVEGN